MKVRSLYESFFEGEAVKGVSIHVRCETRCVLIMEMSRLKLTASVSWSERRVDEVKDD